MVEGVDSPNLGICLDTVNSFGALEGPEAVIEQLASFAVNLHIKDFTIHRPEHNMGFIVEGCPAGQGRLDIPRLLEQIKAAGRDPNAILELWVPPENTVDDTIAREQEWAEISVRYLRTLIPD
jgi:sugar phosphate isomerase/epimerase